MADALTELQALWAEAEQTTRGYKQMPQPLPIGTHWYNAKQHYDAALKLLSTPIPVPTISSVSILGSPTIGTTLKAVVA